MMIKRTKSCPSCKTTKFLIYFFKRKQTKDGYSGTCKACTNKRLELSNLKWRSKHKGRIQKKCNKCRIIKPMAEFCKDTDSKDGYDDYCGSCQRPIRLKASILYVKRHPIKIRRSRRKATAKWQKDNKDLVNQRQKACREKNPLVYKAKDMRCASKKITIEKTIYRADTFTNIEIQNTIKLLLKLRNRLKDIRFVMKAGTSNILLMSSI